MANTDNKSELDSYGVWVKKAPESGSQTSESGDDFNFDVELPDFSEINSSENEKSQNDASGLEDVSIEDFLDNGFSEPPVPDDTIETLAVPDMPDFFAGAEESKNDPAYFPASSESEEASVLPELPESIDTVSAPAQSAPSAETALTEDVDLADFGIDFSADEAPSDTQTTGNVSPAKREASHIDYDLSVSPDDGSISAESAVPDSFDEEAKSLMDNISSPRSESSDLLRQIVEDLSGLKNEISALKTEFAELKSRGSAPASEGQAGGFFSNLDEDETISLSGDELDNIMSSADFLNNESKVDELAEESKIAQENARAEDLAVVPENPEEKKSDDDFSLDDFFTDKTEADAAPGLPVASDEEAELEELPEEGELEELSDTDDIAIPSVDEILTGVAPAEKIENADEVPVGAFDEVTASPEPEALPAADDFFKTDPKSDETTGVQSVPFTDAEPPAAKASSNAQTPSSALPSNLTEEIKSVLLYMDQLLEDLPEEKIVEFARSEQFATYKKLFADLGLS